MGAIMTTLMLTNDANIPMITLTRKLSHLFITRISQSAL
eukprot:XP_001709510.1 Hypothetical protein GL50803_26063 [Giardia lamblia ATCC 50803]